MSEIRNLTRNGETFYPLTCTEGLVNRDGDVVGEINDIFDISEYNATSGTPPVLAKYNTLSLALAAIPTSKQKGGMTIRYIQTSDNKYVQYRNMNSGWSSNEGDWENLSNDINKISVRANNILDLSGTTDGKQISKWDTEIESAAYCYSKKIPVIPGQQLYFYLCWSICAYNGNTAVPSSGIDGNPPAPWTVPENITHIRTNFAIEERSKTNGFPYISVGERTKYIEPFGEMNPKTTNQVEEGIRTPLSSEGAIFAKNTKEEVDRIKEYSNNVLDFTKLTKGYIQSSGTIVNSDSFSTSDFIKVTTGDIVYLHSCRTVCAFNENKEAVPSAASSEQSLYFTYTVPSGIYYIRTYVINNMITKTIHSYVCINRDSLQITAGPYIKPDKILPRYHLFDAFDAWKNGLDFPVGFIGDSTTDGVGTTGWDNDTTGHAHQDEVAGGLGKANYDHIYAYPHILQTFLRSELGNNVPKIYNIGYSGASLNTWRIANFLPQIFAKENDLYYNCRMVGINMGINDRNTANTEGDFIEYVTSNLIYFVEYLLSIGITPFMVTQQIVLQASGLSQGLATLPQNYMQILCNKAKEKVARMYGLELVDLNKFTSLILQCSNYPIGGNSTNRIMDFYNNLHFADKGHYLEAGYLFSRFVPYVLHTECADKVYIGLTNRNARSNILINNAVETLDKFKMQFNGSQSSATNTLIYDAYIMVNSLNGAYSVKYYTPIASGYIVIDGDTNNPVTINSTEMTLDPWDIGLHRVQVYTGVSTTIAFKGFLLEGI